MYLMEFGAFIGAIFSKKLRQQVKGQAKTFYILHKYIKKDDRVVWVHAASLGEFEQGRLLMELIRRRHPEFKILLTFFSPSGYEVRKDYEGADVICYLPFDTPGNAASFLRLAHPDVGIFIKYEFWANYLLMARHKKIPMYSVSSIFRPSQHFFRWYGNKAPLRCFTHFFVQNEESKQLLAGIGQTNVTVVGDTRFDRVILVRKMSSNLPLVETFCNGQRTFIAGSSWESDEEIYIPYFNEHKDWKLIIAPHKITGHHLSQIQSMLQGRKVVVNPNIFCGRTFLKEKHIGFYTVRIKDTGGQTQNCMQVKVFQQFFTYLCRCTAVRENIIRKDNTNTSAGFNDGHDML